jgi:hypothetical protein
MDQTVLTTTPVHLAFFVLFRCSWSTSICAEKKQSHKKTRLQQLKYAKGTGTTYA